MFNCIKDDDIKKIRKEVNEEYEPGVAIEIYRYEREYDLIEAFLNFWENNFPDIVSGWNIDGFDITYIVNRIKKVMPQDSEKRLSPISWHKRAVRMHSEQKLKQTQKVMLFFLMFHMHLKMLH